MNTMAETTESTTNRQHFMIKISGNNVPDFTDYLVDVTDPFAWFNEQKRQAISGETLSLYQVNDDESLTVIEEFVKG